MTANADDHRPDPDALLREIQADQNQHETGKLRVFFGFAPGVGKTYRMLKVARDIKAAGRDVVVGYVETHRRPETLELLEGFEQLPLQQISYRGRDFSEFHLDAALARRPEIILVDELAHTNVNGARHSKRWQDVLDLLDAKMTVFTTVNVQHVESLNDVIAQITGVRVRETIPDSLLDRADEIELIDIGPEELLQRLSDGKVYLPEQANRAKNNFFSRGNLLALRELALRRTAQRVDTDVLKYRERHSVEATWPASERIMVCVGPAPSSARLIRVAHRMATGLRVPWIAAYVEPGQLSVLRDTDRRRLETHLRLVEELGGQVVRLTEQRISEAILSTARRQNVTRIILGKPTHPRWRDWFQGSLVNEIVRGSGEIDVNIVSGESGPFEGQAGEKSTPRAPPTFVLRPYAGALILVIIATLLAALLQRAYGAPDIEIVFFAPIMLTAYWWGKKQAIFAAALGVASYDFFFVPPVFTFGVSDIRYVLSFAMMFVLGWLLSELTSRIRNHEFDARMRESRTAALYALSRDLSAASDIEKCALGAAKHASDVFSGDAMVLFADESGELIQCASFPAHTEVHPNDNGLVRWVYEHDKMAGIGTDTLPGSSLIGAPISIRGRVLGVLALRPRSKESLGSSQREFLGAFCRQSAFAFEHQKLAIEARQAALRAKTEEMRSSLLSSVSHDLRTPLAAITGAATSLRDDPDLPNDVVADLVKSVCEEAERLAQLVTNLLEMTKIDAGEIKLKREWVPLEEIVEPAFARFESKLASHPVSIQIPDDCPLLSVDPVVFQQVFINLIENALKYTPADCPIEMSASNDHQFITIELRDRGPGLPPGTERRVFERFYRGQHETARGAGLGLAICKGIVDAHGGTVTAENAPDGGALFRIRLPLGVDAPKVEMTATESTSERSEVPI